LQYGFNLISGEAVGRADIGPVVPIKNAEAVIFIPLSNTPL
jgi:hypothetical protein